MPEYRLTNAADEDLEKIIRYGIRHFGESSAIQFYEGLLSVLNAITNSPDQYPFAFTAHEKFQKAVYKSYAVFFVQKPEYIEITRVLRKENYNQLLD
ncbi:type II toxin-antitoxin system RelE/ParE family toxin [Glaciecola siphonariae]|uniref:Type II toxin-antitoxin system RelE/ParE family toxin n=1 Tax=Glaciecola siphonariae TaxID=521012 RepID=A0ABV9LY44_9ALTE